MELIVLIIIIGIVVLAIRLLGAWMLRINELITLCKKILMELEEMNAFIRIDQVNNSKINPE